MRVAERRFGDGEGCTASRLVLDGFHLEIESRLLGAGDVESGVTIVPMTLNAGADVGLFTNIALESPTSRRNVFHRIDGFEKDGVGEPDFRNPQGAHDVRPRGVVRLFKRAAFVGTKHALDGAGRRLKATSTQPLTLGNIRNTITVL